MSQIVSPRKVWTWYIWPKNLVIWIFCALIQIGYTASQFPLTCSISYLNQRRVCLVNVRSARAISLDIISRHSSRINFTYQTDRLFHPILWVTSWFRVTCCCWAIFIWCSFVTVHLLLILCPFMSSFVCVEHPYRLYWILCRLWFCAYLNTYYFVNTWISLTIWWNCCGWPWSLLLSIKWNLLS